MGFSGAGGAGTLHPRGSPREVLGVWVAGEHSRVESDECLELSSPKIFLPIHLWRGQRYWRVWSWRFPTFCCLDSQKRAKGRGDSPSPTKNGRVAKKKNWGWNRGGSGRPEACTDPYRTRAPGPLSKKRVKLWPSGKWSRAGPGTHRKPECPSTAGEETNKVAP